MQQRHPQAKVRAAIYAMCGIAIAVSIVVLAIDRILGGVLSGPRSHLEFYGEATGLAAFGVSWLTASRTLPLITRPDERFSPMKANNPR